VFGCGRGVCRSDGLPVRFEVPPVPRLSIRSFPTHCARTPNRWADPAPAGVRVQDEIRYSKPRTDGWRRPARLRSRLPPRLKATPGGNAPAGIQSLIAVLRRRAVARVTLEAIGPCTQPLVRVLVETSFSVKLIDSRRVRCLRTTEGVIAKTEHQDRPVGRGADRTFCSPHERDPAPRARRRSGCPESAGHASTPAHRADRDGKDWPGAGPRTARDRQPSRAHRHPGGGQFRGRGGVRFAHRRRSSAGTQAGHLSLAPGQRLAHRRCAHHRYARTRRDRPYGSSQPRRHGALFEPERDGSQPPCHRQRDGPACARPSPWPVWSRPGLARASASRTRPCARQANTPRPPSRRPAPQSATTKPFDSKLVA